MTYPQGPQYGGQPQGPQYGGYPQQPGYPPPGYGPPQRGGGKTGVIIAVVAAVVVLGTLGITGFVAPGFFLSDDDKSGGENHGDSSTPHYAASAMAEALNAKDANRVQALKCADAGDNLDELATNVQRVESASAGEVRTNGSEASVSLQLRVAGHVLAAEGKLADAGGTWCWQDINTAEDAATAGTTTSTTPLDTSTDDIDISGAEPFLGQFISAINSRDSTTAVAKGCQPDVTKSAVDRAIDAGEKLRLGEMDEDSLTNAAPHATARWRVEGTAQGVVVATTEDSGATWCVSAFSVF